MNKSIACVGCSMEKNFDKCEFFINKSCNYAFPCDTVTAPTHYTSGTIECIDAIRSALTEEEFRGYCKGNVLKYTWRERMKGKDEDLKKAKQDIEFMEAK